MRTASALHKRTHCGECTELDELLTLQASLCGTPHRRSPWCPQCSCAAPGERAPPCLIVPGWIDSRMGRVSVQFSSSGSRSRRTDHFGISPQPSTTSHLEYGVSTVFPCGRRPRSIRTPTPPHGTTRPATVSHSPASIEQRGGTIPVLRPNSTDGWHLFARGGRFRAEDGGRVHPGP